MNWEILADSSFYIAAERSGEDAFGQFRADFPGCELVTCGMVMLEVLPWIRGDKILAHTRRRVLPTKLHSNPALYLAARLAYHARFEAGGRPINVQDIVIAACAMEAGATVLTLDQHFSEIACLKVITAKRVPHLSA